MHELHKKKSPLADINLQIHQTLEEGYAVFLERLTQLDETGARDAFEQFRSILDRHRMFEDVRVLPCLRVGEDISPDELARVEGDHRLIESTLEMLSILIDSIFLSAQPRRTLVTNLARLGRMQGILEHHTERELRFVYPMLDQMGDRELIALLAEGLLETGC